MDASERRKRAGGEAADWFARLQGGEMERAERQLFVAWLRESHLHVTEMLRIAQIHGELKQFAHWARIPTGPKTADDNVVQLPAKPDEGSQCPYMDPPRPPRSRTSTEGHRLRFFAAAAVIVLVVTTAVVLPKIRGQVIETDRGERREVVLSDDSVLEVDPETRLRVKYADAVRQVFLERGRALFRVTKNPNRPFLVQAENTTVRAVGTAFGVEHQTREVIVTVAEGKVAVFRSDGEPHRESALPSPIQQLEIDASAKPEGAAALPSPRDSRGRARANARESARNGPGTIFLTADQQVTVSSTGAAESVREVDSRRALAWAEGRLIFQNDELGKVVAEFNHYNRIQLSVVDPNLAAKPVSGVFNALDPEAFIAFLQSVAAVEIVRGADGSISIASESPH